MTDVRPIAAPSLDGKRLAFVLAEDRVGHYPEFRDFLVRSFDLDRVGLAEPGYVSAPSGLAYALVGRSGESFPAGVELYAVADALEPLDETATDRDLWAILQWLVAGTGGPWTAADLERTGRLYRIPAAADVAMRPR